MKQKPNRADPDSPVGRHGFDAVMKGLVSVPKNGANEKLVRRRRRKAKKKQAAR